MKILSNLKGKFLVLSLLVTILGTSSSVALAKEAPVTSPKVGVTISQSEITPYGAIYYEKTVKKTYSSISQVPEYIAYSEYNDTYGTTFSGRLYLVSAVKNSSGSYVATFTGTLGGSGL